MNGNVFFYYFGIKGLRDFGNYICLILFILFYFVLFCLFWG